MQYIKDKTQRQALNYVGLREMPKLLAPYDTRFWIKALVLVTRYSGQQSFVVADRKANGVIRYTKDFESGTLIKGMVGIYPYMFLDEGRVPTKPLSIDELRRHFPNADIDEADEEQMRVLSLQVAIDRQLAEPDPYGISPDETEIEEAPNVSTEDGTIEVEQSSITEDITIESIEMVNKPAEENPKRGRKAKK